MRASDPRDIYHRAGDTLEQGFRLNSVVPETLQGTPANLTGWTAGAQLRNARTRATLAGLSATLANQSTDPGVVTLNATAETTAAWTAGPSLLYDLFITETATGFVRTVVSGCIVVEQD